MKGTVALHGNRKGAIWSDRVQKKKRPVGIRKCFGCGKILFNRNGNAIYCGSDRKKTGCSFKAKQNACRKWKTKVKYWNWPKRKVKQLEYGRKYDRTNRVR